MVTSTTVEEPGLLPETVLEATRLDDDVDVIDREQSRAALASKMFSAPKREITIDRFVVVGSLGAGAMGRVYRARDPRLERDVAIKVVRRSALGTDPIDRRQARMIDEARALAQLDHPNVVSIYEVGEVDHGVYIAMQYVDGPTLRSWQQERERSWSEVVRVFADAGRGLAAAHARGLVHRDFKPANVFLSHEDGRALVGDFGLARLVHGPSTTDESTLVSADSQRTRTGAVMGTPAYMAPEQLRGEPLDGRADQYAFGIALFEALHGRRPDQSEPSRAQHWPRWLDDVVSRAIAEDPANRYPDMDTVVTALTRDRGAIRRRGLAVTGLVAVTGFGAFMAARGAPPEAPADPCAVAQERIAQVLDEPARARLQERLLAEGGADAEARATAVQRAVAIYAERWTTSRRDACEATWVRHEQSEALFDRRMRCLDGRSTAMAALLESIEQDGDLPPHRIASAAHRLPRLEHCNDTERLLADVPLPEDPDVALQVKQLQRRLTAAKVDSDLGRIDEALEQARTLVREAEPLHYPAVLAAALSLEARQYRERGQLEQAEATLERALHESQAAGNDRLTVQILAALAHEVGAGQERREDGQRWLAQAQAVMRRVGDDRALLAFLDNERGNLLLAEGRFAEARPAYAAALEGTLEALGPEHRRVAGAHLNLGNIARLLGEYELALEHLDQAQALLLRLYGPVHPVVAHTALTRGATFGRQRRWPQAEQAYREAYDAFVSMHGPDNLDVARSLASLANVYLAQDDPSKAREHYRQARAIFESKLRPGHPLIGGTLSNIAHTYNAQGDCDSALPKYERGLAIKVEGQGPRHPGLLTTLDPMVDCLLRVGHAEQALPLIDDAITIRRELGDEPGEALGYSLTQRGIAEQALGRSGVALPSLEEALQHYEQDPDEPPTPRLEFALAQLLVDREPERARTLATRALEVWRTEGEDERAAEAERWLGMNAAPR